MKNYFILQYRRFYRHIKEAKINPYLGYGLMAIFFWGLSYLFFERVPYPQYIYPFIALSLLNLLGGSQRNEFLKNCFSAIDYHKVRLVENLVMTTPFFIFLFYKQEYLAALTLYSIAGILSLFNQINRFQWAMPTPFYRFPFEFTVGFRKYYVLFFLTYVLAVISLFVGNFNMGCFTFILVFLNTLGFYSKPEPNTYVWIHAMNPAAFLKHKMKIGVFYSFALSLPLFVLLWVFYPENLWILLLIEAFGLLCLLTILLGKYAYYPSEVNIIPMILMSLCVFLPPFCLFVLPFFYFKAKQNLQSILT